MQSSHGRMLRGAVPRDEASKDTSTVNQRRLGNKEVLVYTATPRTSPWVRSDQRCEATPAVVTRASGNPTRRKRGEGWQYQCLFLL
eukprot:4583547-Pyramimonas_sp.AAC.1